MVFIAAEGEGLVEEVVLTRPRWGDVATRLYFEGDDVGCMVVGGYCLCPRQASTPEAEVEDEDAEDAEGAVDDPENGGDKDVPVVIMVKDSGMAGLKERSVRISRSS